MTLPLRALGRMALEGLADDLASGRLVPPFRRASLEPHVPAEHVEAVRAALDALVADGMHPRHVARALRLLAEERAASQRVSDRVQLVWSPPDLDAVDARDTAVVVQELFRRAERSVLIATFALDEKRKAAGLFGELAARMDAEPALAVRVLANVHRRHGDDTPASTLVREFAARMRTDIWPGERLPEVYYDPRSLLIDAPARAVLHAKAVVIDARVSFLTSANFTEAAHARNIEAGVVLDDATLAERLTRQFELLIERGHLRRVD